MKAILSQPMAGKTEEEIIATRERAIAALKSQGYEVVNTMSLCNAAYFCKGWEHDRGCKIEHDAAVTYGMTILYET